MLLYFMTACCGRAAPVPRALSRGRTTAFGRPPRHYLHALGSPAPPVILNVSCQMERQLERHHTRTMLGTGAPRGPSVWNSAETSGVPGGRTRQSSELRRWPISLEHRSAFAARPRAERCEAGRPALRSSITYIACGGCPPVWVQPCSQAALRGPLLGAPQRCPTSSVPSARTARRSHTSAWTARRPHARAQPPPGARAKTRRAKVSDGLALQRRRKKRRQL